MKKYLFLIPFFFALTVSAQLVKESDFTKSLKPLTTAAAWRTALGGGDGLLLGELVQSPLGYTTVGGNYTLFMTRAGIGTNGWIGSGDFAILWNKQPPSAILTNLSDLVDGIGYLHNDGAGNITWVPITGVQTPWESDVDGGGYALSNVSRVELANTNGTPGRFTFGDSDNSNFFSIEAPSDIGTNYNIIFPDQPFTGLWFAEVIGTNVYLSTIPEGNDGDVLTSSNNTPAFLPPTSASASVAFDVQTIIVTNTNAVVLDLASYDVFKLMVLTNFSYTFSNATSLEKKAYVYFQMDSAGGWLLSTSTVAGGILQTNANMQPTTNANALDLLEVMPGFQPTNLLAWWPQNFLPRVGYTNTLPGGGDSPTGAITINFLADFETGTNGQTLSLADYTNSTKSLFTGAWSFLDSASSNYFGISTGVSYNSTTNITVDGISTNQTDTGTRSLAAYAGTSIASGTRAYVNRNFTTPLTDFVFCYYFQNNYNVTNFENVDSILFQNGSDYAVVQFRTYDPFGYRTHSSHADSVGNIIPVNTRTNHNHLISGYYDATDGKFMFGVFDAVTHAQLSTNSWMNMQSVPAVNLTIEAKKSANGDEITNYFDNFMISTNAADFPTNPTNGTIRFLPWPH